MSSQSEESTTSETSQSSSYDTSSTEIDYLQTKNLGKDEFSFLLQKSNLFEDTNIVYDNMTDKCYVMSNDIVLYYIIVFDYINILSTLDKKTKKTVNKLLNSRQVQKEDVSMILTGKLCNIDISEVYKAYQALEIKNNYVLYVSKCVYSTKEDRDELSKLFEHLKDKNLKIFPACLEEIFLDEVCEHHNNMIHYNIPYKVYLVSKEELEKYFTAVKGEITEN